MLPDQNRPQARQGEGEKNRTIEDAQSFAKLRESVKEDPHVTRFNSALVAFFRRLREELKR
jgi:hypothetical protein